ncbi:unnamed protein product [Oikopleura dioica]|uniref:Uncharacterized protein n=1 Tax=Oikopleura dioica TaxID=34765 RepID=E4Y1L7_OIKDI|nr:unnamed protein product [Oikopleura dioica]
MSTGMLPFPVAVDPNTPISFTTVSSNAFNRQLKSFITAYSYCTVQASALYLLELLASWKF